MSFVDEVLATVEFGDGITELDVVICRSKMQFTNKQKAKEAARRAKAKYSHGQKPYKCHVCDQYHLTST